MARQLREKGAERKIYKAIDALIDLEDYYKLEKISYDRSIALDTLRNMLDKIRRITIGSL